jgi:hypothetical protein
MVQNGAVVLEKEHTTHKKTIYVPNDVTTMSK